MNDKEAFYRNIDVGEGEEISVRAFQGFGPVIEILVEGGVSETVIRLMSPSGAMELGKAIMLAAQSLMKEG